MLSNFLVQQVLEVFEREATFQGFRVNFFLWAKRGGRVGLINICRYSLHTIGVFCPTKVELFWLMAKISSFFHNFAQRFIANENQTRNS
jgi:hypothetical protein